MSATPTTRAILNRPDAEALIFAQAPEVPRPDTRWLAAAALGQDSRPSAQCASSADNHVLFVQLRYAEHRRDLGGAEAARWAEVAVGLRGRIAELNMGLVFYTARDHGHGEERAERIAQGSLALLRAIDRFDPFRGYVFSTLAMRCIKNAYIEDRRTYARRRARLRVSAPGDHLLDAVAAWQSLRRHADGADEAAREARRADLLAALASNAVTDEDRAVLVARFGLDGGDPLNIEALSKRLRVSKQKTCRIVKAALVRVQRAMKPS